MERFQHSALKIKVKKQKLPKNDLANTIHQSKTLTGASAGGFPHRG
jgi:hypothetical protein